MTVRKIARLGEPILRRVAKPVAEKDFGAPWLLELVRDMIDTMREANGAGLAAPQVFESVAVCVLEVNENPRYPAFPAIPLTVLVNPVVTPLDAARSGVAIYEGCLSVPGLRGRVIRARKVRLQAQTLDGQPIVREFEGVPAAVLQHEVDHLLGVLFVDRAEPRTLGFSEEYERYVPVEERVVDPFERGAR